MSIEWLYCVMCCDEVWCCCVYCVPCRGQSSQQPHSCSVWAELGGSQKGEMAGQQFQHQQWRQEEEQSLAAAPAQFRFVKASNIDSHAGVRGIV